MPHPFAFFLAKGWETSTLNLYLSIRIEDSCTVPHPFAFFLAKGWETSTLNLLRASGAKIVAETAIESLPAVAGTCGCFAFSRHTELAGSIVNKEIIFLLYAHKARQLRKMGSLRNGVPMTYKARSRNQKLIVVFAVPLAVALLLLRLFVFVHGHGRRGVRVAANGTHLSMAAFRPATDRPAPAWSNSFGDGTPDFLRLTDPADQAAFRQWFTLIADYQAIGQNLRFRRRSPIAPACCVFPIARRSSATTKRGF